MLIHWMDESEKNSKSKKGGGILTWKTEEECKEKEKERCKKMCFAVASL